MALESSYQPDYLYDIIYQNDGDPLYLNDKVSLQEDSEMEIIDDILLKSYYLN